MDRGRSRAGRCWWRCARAGTRAAVLLALSERVSCWAECNGRHCIQPMRSSPRASSTTVAAAAGRAASRSSQPPGSGSALGCADTRAARTRRRRTSGPRPRASRRRAAPGRSRPRRTRSSRASTGRRTRRRSPPARPCPSRSAAARDRGDDGPDPERERARRGDQPGHQQREREHDTEQAQVRERLEQIAVRLGDHARVGRVAQSRDAEAEQPDALEQRMFADVDRLMPVRSAGSSRAGTRGRRRCRRRARWSSSTAFHTCETSPVRPREDAASAPIAHNTPTTSSATSAQPIRRLTVGGHAGFGPSRARPRTRRR